jgi:hypothetical protein
MDQPTTLTTRDAALLQNLFALNRSLFALASHHNLPLPELIDWLSQPHIQAARDLIARELAEGLKSEALEILRQIARTSDDPVERRRATTQILRALNPPRAPRGASVPLANRGQAAAPGSNTYGSTNGSTPAWSPRDEASPASDALALLAAAETFRSEILSTCGPSLDESLDTEDDDDLEDIDDLEEDKELVAYTESALDHEPGVAVRTPDSPDTHYSAYTTRSPPSCG